MKKLIIWSSLMLLLGCMVLPLRAQTYEKWWKEVETLEKKDLPQSLIDTLDKIYRKALAERNAPQMIKAYLMRADNQISLTPDSLQSELDRLKAWTERETDPVARAVLNSVTGYYLLQQSKEVNEAFVYFLRSLEDKNALAAVKAEAYRPMTESGKLSEKYFGDTMLDLLTRQAVKWLNRYVPVLTQVSAQQLTVDLYTGLIDYYAATGNRSSELLTRICLLEYVQRHYVHAPLRVSEVEAIARMQEWTQAYADTKACAAVYACLAELYDRRREYVKEMDVIREGLKRYPKSEFAADLKSQERMVQLPSLSLSTSGAYPGEECTFEVTSRNLRGMTLEVYRLNLKASSSVFARNPEHAALIKNHGKLCDKRHFSLPATPHYGDTLTTLTYRMPEAGIYVLKAIPDGYPDKTTYELLHLSSLQVLSFPLPDEETEFYVVDRRSGHPVPGAEIVLYSIPVPGNYTFYKSFKTDVEGKVRVAKQTERSLWMHARTNREEAMDVVYMNFSLLHPMAPDEEKETVDLFTDRMLYRPGQPVYVSGVAYRQTGDEVKVRSGRSMELVLRDANRKEIGKKQVVTDDFGGFSAEFMLPETTLPGDFQLTAAGENTHFIRVEAYKRPTFDVTFSPYKKAYHLGDTLTVEGKAMNFSGVPVRNGKVRYTLTRTRAWFWRADGWAEEIAQGEASTDADGHFEVEACLQKPDYADDQPWQGYYRYQVKAEVTDGAGETQSGTLTLAVGSQSLSLRVEGLREKVMREKEEKVRFMARNLNGKPVDVTIYYKVYALNEKGEKGERVQSASIPSNVDDVDIVPSLLLNLPSGRYRVELSATDEQGRLCKGEQDYTLFSESDTRPPFKDVQWFYQDGTELHEVAPVASDEGEVQLILDEEQDEARPTTLYVGSSEKDVCVFYQIYSGNKRIHSERFTLNNEVRKFTYTYKPEYGDGITVSFAFMRKGIFYTKEVHLTRPLPKKELKLKWETFRDKLTPGGEEEWCLTIAHPDGKPADARLLATLYDASLDRLLANNWSFNLQFNRRVPSVYPSSLSVRSYLMLTAPFYRNGGSSVAHELTFSNYYSRMDIPSWQQPMRLSLRGNGVRPLAASRALYAGAKAKADGVQLDAGFEKRSEIFAVVKCSAESLEEEEAYLPLRENFAETAFFYPDLRTDSAGNVRIVFTLPDALTEWKLMGFAHTRELDYGLITAKAKTSKPFMIQPNMPRFVRVGDRTTLMASLNNLSAETVSGVARMQLADPITGKVVYSGQQPFRVEAGENGTIGFMFEVDGEQEMLVCKLTADAGDFSDGEQHYLPVLTNRQWMTETLPVQMNGEGQVVVRTKDLFNGQSQTTTERRLTVELTATPDWYVLQALPVIANPVNNDALSWMSAYYAHAVASMVMKKYPVASQLFKSWMEQGATKESLLSKLETNQDLKQILLAETPWVAEAADETEQKRRIALLFDLNRMNSNFAQAEARLRTLQHADGSWGWYEGMSGSRIVTTQIVEMLARLKNLGFSLNASVETMYQHAADYLKATLLLEYEHMRTRERQGQTKVYPSEQAIRYLYIGALDASVAGKADKNVVAYLIGKLENRSAEYTIYEKALTALIFHANGKKREAADLMQSVREYAVYTPEMGRYFDTRKAVYSWNSYKIPTQVAVMEAMQRIAPDKQALAEMKQWLLKQKQVQAWRTPIATADAVYVFFVTGEKQVVTTGSVTAVIGTARLEASGNRLDAVRQSFTGTETQVPEIRFEKTGGGLSWGAVYAQFFEETSKLKEKKGNGVSVVRTYYLDGKKVTAGTSLKVGDKLTVRLQVKADRDMDFIQLRDGRAACMQPEEQLSGYRVSDGISYYQVSRDASTDFFMDKLRKGQYTIEYKVYIDRSGVYQAGAATIQSAYAPEFGGHSDGGTLTVE